MTDRKRGKLLFEVQINWFYQWEDIFMQNTNRSWPK